MSRKIWLFTVLCFLVIILAWFWWWFLRYQCSDNWCLVLDSRKAELQQERKNLDNANLPARTNVNTNANANVNSNANQNANSPSNTNTVSNANTGTNTNSANEADIQVTSPVSGDAISSPFTLTGKAREFENVFNYRVKDADGTVLASNHVLYNSPDAGEFGNFSISVTFTQPTGTHGTVEVFALSARDGSEIDMVRIPVTFQ